MNDAAMELAQYEPLLSQLTDAKLQWLDYCSTTALEHKGDAASRAESGIQELISYSQKISQVAEQARAAVKECKSDSVKQIVTRSLLHIEVDETFVLDLIDATRTMEQQEEFANELWKLYKEKFPSESVSDCVE
jgi:hypothetical protein